MEFVAFSLWFATFTPSERVALIAAFLVLVGVAGEYVIELPAIEERTRLKARIKRLSMALLLLGLAGDVLGIVMGQAEMAALTREASDAAASAKTAREEADAVKITASQARAWVLRLGPRVNSFDTKKFVESLNGVAQRKVEVLYERENEEAYTIAMRVTSSLGPGMGNAGWHVSGPRPANERDAFADLIRNPVSQNVPLIMRVGGSGGLGVIANPKESIGASALRQALANSGAFIELQQFSEATIPDGVIRIVIGKPFR